MKSGKAPGPPGEKKARGTWRPDRHAKLTQPEERSGVPLAPEWLTKGWGEIWLDLVTRVVAAGKANDLDSHLIGTLANLIAASADCWASGAVPPAAHLAEMRRLSELFGLAGVSSRVLGAGVTPSGDNAFARLRNQFAVNGRRPADGT